MLHASSTLRLHFCSLPRLAQTNDLDTTLRGVFFFFGGDSTSHLHFVHGIFWRRPATYSLLKLLLFTAHFLAGSRKKNDINVLHRRSLSLSLFFLCFFFFFVSLSLLFFPTLSPPLQVVRAYAAASPCPYYRGHGKGEWSNT